MNNKSTNSEQEMASEVYILRKVRIMCACYRKDDAADPDLYAGAAVAVFSDYPLDIVEFLTDPRTGLPSQVQWLPTIKEIRDACEKMQAAKDAPTLNREAAQKQFAERAKFEAEQSAKSERPTYDELKSKYGANWGLTDLSDEDKETRERSLAFLARANETFLARDFASSGIERKTPLSASPSLLRSLKERCP